MTFGSFSGFCDFSSWAGHFGTPPSPGMITPLRSTHQQSPVFAQHWCGLKILMSNYFYLLSCWRNELKNVASADAGGWSLWKLEAHFLFLETFKFHNILSLKIEWNASNIWKNSKFLKASNSFSKINLQIKLKILRKNAVDSETSRKHYCWF